MDGDSALAAFIKSSPPKLREVEPLLEVLQELGVQELEDLSYIQESDLLHVLKPVEVRKLLSHFKTTSQRDVLDSPLSNQQSSNRASESPQTRPDEMFSTGGYSSASSTSPMSTSSSRRISHPVDCLTTAGISSLKFLGTRCHLRSSESWKQGSDQQRVRDLK